jgi:transcriptional regulator with XRE-family HTH domain
LLYVRKPHVEPVPRPQNSELWQRLRAARELARKSRDDVGHVVGLNQAVVALWESPDPSSRTQPSAQQVMRIAKLCGLPLFLLIDDAVSMHDIKSFTGL